MRETLKTLSSNADMTNKLTINIKTEIEQARLTDVVYSMAEGSGYWCKYAGDLGYESTVLELLAGKTVKLEDFEDAEARYTLTLPKLKRGLKVMALDFPKHFLDILTENDDSDTADVLLQCSLFGEVIYG